MKLKIQIVLTPYQALRLAKRLVQLEPTSETDRIILEQDGEDTVSGMLRGQCQFVITNTERGSK